MDGGGFAADFSWPDRRLIVEVDGWETHGDRRSFEEDRRRDAMLGAAGWTVIRFTWFHVVREPRFVVATLAAHGAARGPYATLG
jgi:very-short-patch-repair endonuclease